MQFFKKKQISLRMSFLTAALAGLASAGFLATQKNEAQAAGPCSICSGGACKPSALSTPRCYWINDYCFNNDNCQAIIPPG